LAAEPLASEEERSPDLRDYWQIIRQGRWYIVLSFVLVVGSTAFFTFTAEPVYEAEAKLLVEQGTPSGMGELLQLLNAFTPGGRNDLENRIEVLLSRPVLERAREKLLKDPEFVALRRELLARKGVWTTVAEVVGLDHSDQLDLSAEELLTLKDLEERISAQPIRNTDVIVVKAKGNAPREAQLLANAVVQAYLEAEEEQTKRTISNVKQFLEEQLAQSQARLEASEEQAVAFQKRSGLELGTEGATKNLIELNKLLIQGRIELEDKQGALKAVRQLLADVRKELLDEEATSEDVEALLLELRNKVANIRKIQLEISDLEEERAQALAEGNYIKAQALENQILQKKQEIEQQGQKQFEVLNLLPKYEELIQQEMELTLEIEALKNRLKVIQDTIDQETQKLIDNGLELMRFERNLEVDKDIYILLRQEYEKARIAEAGEPGTVRLVQPAEEPEAPIAPKKGLNLLLAAIVGLTLGTGLSFLRAYLDNTLKTPKDVEAAGLIPLGTVFEIQGPRTAKPKAKGAEDLQEVRRELLVNFEARSSVYDAYLGLKTNLHFAALNQPLKAMVISSSLPSEGKTLTTLNLGLAMARSGEKVLVVDADLRNPSITELFGLKEEKGFTDLLLKNLNPQRLIQAPYTWAEWRWLDPQLLKRLIVKREKLLSAADWEKALRLQRRRPTQPLEQVLVQQGFLTKRQLEKVVSSHLKGLEDFYVLPAGTPPPSAAALLGSGKVKPLIEKLKEEFRFILFDSPPVLLAPDTAILGQTVDGVLLVIEAERTAGESVRQAREQLEKGGIRVIGGLLNRLKPETASYYGYGGYGYGYGYGYHRRDEEEVD